MDGIPDESVIKIFVALAVQHPAYAFITIWLVVIIRGVPVIIKALAAWRVEHTQQPEEKDDTQ